MPIRAVIFDFNGVLVDDEEVHFQLFREVLAGEGIVLTEADYHSEYLGYDDRGVFEVALSRAGRSPDLAALTVLIARKAERYSVLAASGLRVFPGAAECVRAASARGPVAVCSGALRAEIEFALARMGVRDQILAIISAEDTTRCKPDPEGYLRTLEALRARALPDLAAAECLVIEDSLAGIEAARDAGMCPVAVAHTYTIDELTHAGASAVMPSLAEFTSGFLAVSDPEVTS